MLESVGSADPSPGGRGTEGGYCRAREAPVDRADNADVDYTVRLVDAGPSPTAVVPAATSWSEYPSLWRVLLDEVYAAVAGGTIEQDGQNVMLYLDDTPRVEVGIQVTGSFPPVGRVVPSALPVGPAAMTVHLGPYARLDDAHLAVRNWCAMHQHRPTGVRWEIYGDWTEDPARLETEVWYQVG